MTSRTPRRHRRLALMAAGTAVAMLLVPGTALAEEGTPAVPDVADTLEDLTDPSGVAPEAPALPAVPGLPGLPGVPGLPPLPALPGAAGDDSDDSDDSEGHVTEAPQFPDHGSGFVGDLLLNDEDILDLVQYDATINDDGSTTSDARVLGLFGDEIIGSGSNSSGPTESRENPTEGICEATGGALCLSLLYHQTLALVDDKGSVAGARGGVLSLCLLGEDPSITTTYECDGLLGAGAAEGEGAAERDGKSGHTAAYSDNELIKACLTEGWENFTCQGLLGASVLHADSDSESQTPDTDRNSWLIGLDSGGEALLRIEDPIGLSIPPGCGDVALLCLFLNQGRSFFFDNPQGAGSAQEALSLDLLKDTPLDILVELGRAESIAHLEPPKDGKKPECDDGIDNDGDGKIDFPKDPECVSKEDDSEADGKKGAGLADTGADVAPLLAGSFLLIGLGALTVAVTRRRAGKHTV